MKRDFPVDKADWLDKTAYSAVSEAILETLNRDIPIVYLLDGVICKEHSDGQIVRFKVDDEEFAPSLPAMGHNLAQGPSRPQRVQSGKSVLRIFAGPNGSGKSTIHESIAKRYESGVFVNADNIDIDLQRRGSISLKEYGLTSAALRKGGITFSDVISTSSWRNSPNGSAIVAKSHISEKEGELLLHMPSDTGGYAAAIAADIIRDLLLRLGHHFSIETVMSHPSKIEFMDKAAKAGYKCYLYYICTISPLINRERVRARVQKGGHPVQEGRITARYYRSLNLLPLAIARSFRAFIFDNSRGIRSDAKDGSGRLVCLEFHEGRVRHRFMKDLPRWVLKFAIPQ